MAGDFSLNCPAIDASERFYLARREERRVWDIAKVVRHDPDVLFRGHPIVGIELGEVYRARVTAQGAFAAQIEIDVEVAQGQLAQGAVDRLAISAAREVGFCDRAPMVPDFEDGDDMIGVVIRFQVEKQRRETDHSERGGGEGGAFQAMGGVFTQNDPRRPGSGCEMVRDRVEESLNANRRLESAKPAKLRRRKHRKRDTENLKH